MNLSISLDKVWGLTLEIREENKALSRSFRIFARGNGQTSPEVSVFVDDGGNLVFQMKGCDV